MEASDLLKTLGWLMLGIAVACAIPILTVIVVAAVVAYLVYAWVHDTRLAMEKQRAKEAENTDERK